MDLENKNKIFETIEKHLERGTAVIAVFQGKNKRQKPEARINKFLWSKADVLKDYASVEAFIKDLPNHGFTDGAILQLKRFEGRGAKTHAETILNFENTTPSTPVTPHQTPPVTETNKAPVMNTQQPQPQNVVPQPQVHMAAPMPVAMGYTQVPQHDFVALKVKEERYLDLTEKLKKVESDLADAKSELRIEKEKSYAAEKKLETIIDRKDFEKQKALADKEGALDKLMNNEAIVNGLGTLLGKVPETLEAMKGGGGNPVALGNPIANFSETKKQLVSQIQSLPDNVVMLLINTATGLTTEDQFAAYLQEGLNQIQPNNS